MDVLKEYRCVARFALDLKNQLEGVQAMADQPDFVLETYIRTTPKALWDAIVNPDNRTALIADANGYYLTLTTCWPLWAGAFATQRYIIHATQYWPVPVRPGYI